MNGSITQKEPTMELFNFIFDIVRAIIGLVNFF
jgi:hypothetical protein